MERDDLVDDKVGSGRFKGVGDYPRPTAFRKRFLFFLLLLIVVVIVAVTSVLVWARFVRRV